MAVAQAGGDSGFIAVSPPLKNKNFYGVGVS
jgi:hypothetical protein